MWHFTHITTRIPKIIQPTVCINRGCKTMEKVTKMAKMIISETAKPDTNIFNPHTFRYLTKFEAINL